MSMKMLDELDELLRFSPSTEMLLRDDVWLKFDMDFGELPGLSDILSPSEIIPETSAIETLAGPFAQAPHEILHHDCMWAGHCVSREHVPVTAQIPQPILPPMMTAAQMLISTNSAYKASNQQRSLLKPSVRAANQLLISPPMSDEEGGSKTEPSSNGSRTVDDVDEDDDDLCDYLDDDNVDDEEREEDEKMKNIRVKFAAESDHSYHKGMQPSVCYDYMGIDTPSDSEEEEIDVGSVADTLKQNSMFYLSERSRTHKIPTTRLKNPYNPSSGVKVMLPCKNQTNYQKCPAQVKNKGVKRQYHGYNSSNSHSSYKRKHYSSDSEPEPMEKRNLHNNMERKRRIDLRNAFDYLRKLVPEVSKKERAAKVVILREATAYCNHLTKVGENNAKTIEELNRKQKMLRNKVSQLRKNLANMR